MDREKLRPEIRAGLRAKLTIRELEDGWRKLVIEEGLSENNGNQCRTAIQLGMHRNTLSRAIEELKIDLTQFRYLGHKKNLPRKLHLKSA